MLTPLNLYTSDPASLKIADLAVDLSQHKGWKVVLHPLDQLPLPQPERVNALLLEQKELKDALACAEWVLEMLASGKWQPDAALEYGAVADREALTNRLRAVNQSLESLKKGGQNG